MVGRGRLEQQLLLCPGFLCKVLAQADVPVPTCVCCAVCHLWQVVDLKADIVAMPEEVVGLVLCTRLLVLSEARPSRAGDDSGL